MNAAGWTVTVYDRNREIGGLLASGVPPFKLDKALLARRRVWLEAAGVRFELGVEVDGARVRRLAAENDALFLGIGAQRPVPASCPDGTCRGARRPGPARRGERRPGP